MPARDIGEPLTGLFPVPGGEARLHARGLTIAGPGLELRAFFDLPPIGRPNIVSEDPAGKRVFAIEIEAAGKQRRPSRLWRVEGRRGVFARVMPV